MSDFCHQDMEASWAAGFFDGEGCTHLRDNGRGKSYTCISISQAHVEVLERFKAAVGGAGRINGPVNYVDRRPMWFYQATWRPDVLKVREVIYKYLSSEKKKQMDEKFEAGGEIRHYAKRLKPEAIDGILDDYRSGMSYKDISKKYGRTYDAVVKVISSRRVAGTL